MNFEKPLLNCQFMEIHKTSFFSWTASIIFYRHNNLNLFVHVYIFFKYFMFIKSNIYRVINLQIAIIWVDSKINFFTDENTRDSSEKIVKVESRHIKRIKGIFSAKSAASLLPTRYELLNIKTFSNGSSTFGVRDMACTSKNSWLLRVDGPHKGAEFHHLNINPELTGVPDPHLWLPTGSAQVGSVARIGIKTVGIGMLAAAVASDSYRFASTFDTWTFKTVIAHFL